MSKIKIGYRAVFYAGEEVTGINRIRDTYEEAVNDIEIECVDEKVFCTFTHAKVEKIYLRSNKSI